MGGVPGGVARIDAGSDEWREAGDPVRKRVDDPVERGGVPGPHGVGDAAAFDRAGRLVKETTFPGPGPD